MDEKTRMYNDDEEFFNEENAENENLEDEIAEEEKTGTGLSVPGYISLGVGVAVGLGAGIFGTHIAYGNTLKEDIPQEPSPIPETSFLADILVKADTPIAKGIAEDMSLEDAYAAAREQVGPGGVFVWNGSVYGTYNEEEWNGLTDEQQNDYFSNFNLLPETTQEVNLIENVPVSTMVNDDMSFGEAFASARDELGTGGVFMWQGNAYNTYYKEEWADMNAAEKDTFLAGYLEIPDENLIPTANQMDTHTDNEYNMANEEKEAGGNPEYHEMDDTPVAQVIDIGQEDHFEITGSDMINEVLPPDDGNENFIKDDIRDSPVADMGSVEGSFIPTAQTDNTNELIPDNTNVNDFIDEILNQGKRAEQQNENDSDESVLPDDFITGVGTGDDLDV